MRWQGSSPARPIKNILRSRRASWINSPILENKLKNKEKLLQEVLRTEGSQLSESLSLQASKYMQAVWRVGGEPKEDLNDVIEQE